MTERERYEAWLGVKPSGQAHEFGFEVWRAAVLAEREACAELCWDLAMKTVDKDLKNIQSDDGSEYPRRDWDSDDASLNELHPITLEENTRKAQTFMAMLCEAKIRKRGKADMPEGK